MSVLSGVEDSVSARVESIDFDRFRLRSFIRALCAVHTTAGPHSRAIVAQCPAEQWLKSACRVPIRKRAYEP